MKQVWVVLLAGMLILGLCACQSGGESVGESLPEAAGSGGGTGSSLPGEVALPEPAYAGEEISGGKDILPPELAVGVSREEADFLTPEQWAIYDAGAALSTAFLVSPGYFPGEGKGDSVAPSSREWDGHSYRRYAGRIYSGYTDFYYETRKVFTEELFQQLNTVQLVSGEPPVYRYREFDGKLYCLDVDSGGNPMVLHDLTRFEEVSRGEERVEFNQIAYFCTWEEAGAAERTAVGFCRCPVALVKEDDGWKVAEFSPIYQADSEMMEQK